MNKSKSSTVYGSTKAIIERLDDMKSTLSGKKALAELRRSAGRPLNQTIDMWGFLLQYLPEDSLSYHQELTREETAVIIAVQLYALHQQGISESVMLSEQENYHNFGSAVRAFRTADNQKALDRRFTILMSSSSFERFVYYLRQMINLMKRSEVKIDYAKLARDLYQLLWEFESQETSQVKLSWAKSYYYALSAKEEEK